MKILSRATFAAILLLLSIVGFSQMDTTSINTWDMMHNSTASWEEGAFSAHATTHPDYGWGTYNMITHDLKGDSIYVLKLLNDEYKRLWIREKKSIANRYIFWYSDLDGSNEKQIDLDINDYSSKLFVNYSLSGDSVVNTQPESTWDIVLTRFLQPTLGYYPSTGFMANEDVSISLYSAPDSTTAAAATLADTTEFTDSIAAIGNGWYSLQGYSIVPLDTMVYFVKVPAGDIYKMQMTYFESGYSGQGRVGIRKQRLSGDTPETEFVYDTLVLGQGYAGDVYFNMGTDTKTQVQRATWEIGFKSAQFSSSIWINDISGVELYTYPNADGTIWGPAVHADPISASAGLKIYPVPARNVINVSYEIDTQHPVSVRVFDMTGKLVMERSETIINNSELQFDVAALSEGIYFLQLKNSEIQKTARFSIRK